MVLACKDMVVATWLLVMSNQLSCVRSDAMESHMTSAMISQAEPVSTSIQRRQRNAAGLTLNGSHEHHLGGHGGNDALGVDQRWVAEVVKGCKSQQKSTAARDSGTVEIGDCKLRLQYKFGRTDLRSTLVHFPKLYVMYSLCHVIRMAVTSKVEQ